MDKLTAVTLIMIAAFMAQAATTYFKSRPRSAKVDDNLKRENAELKSRIAALEAIVTEPGYELKQQISRL